MTARPPGPQDAEPLPGPPAHAEPAPVPAAGRRPDASMTLLTEVDRSPLDPGYALVAHRRATGEKGRRSPARAAVLLVTAAVLGIGVTAAAQTLLQPAASAQQARDVLESSIVERNDAVAALQQDVEELSAQIAALQSRLVGDADGPLRAEVEAGAVQAGQLPVSGPGLVVRLSDAPAAVVDDPEDPARVQDLDLQVVVNGLWAAGAEAIAINDQRIGPTTAIRSAGSAVLVDLVPLTNPYRVEVVGNAPALQTALTQGDVGELLGALRATYGIGVDVSAQDSVSLPGAGQATLRYAEVPDGALPEPLVSPTARATTDPGTLREQSVSPSPPAVAASTPDAPGAGADDEGSGS